MISVSICLFACRGCNGHGDARALAIMFNITVDHLPKMVHFSFGLAGAVLLDLACHCARLMYRRRRALAPIGLHNLSVMMWSDFNLNVSPSGCSHTSLHQDTIAHYQDCPCPHSVIGHWLFIAITVSICLLFIYSSSFCHLLHSMLAVSANAASGHIQWPMPLH